MQYVDICSVLLCRYGMRAHLSQVNQVGVVPFALMIAARCTFVIKVDDFIYL